MPPTASEPAKRFVLPEHLQRLIDPLPRASRLDALGDYAFQSQAITPAKKAALMAFVREAQSNYVDELAQRATTPVRRTVLPHLLHAMAVTPGKIATALKQVGYDHKRIAKTLFALPRVRHIHAPIRGRVPRFGEMFNEGSKIVSALQEAGFNKSTHVAEALNAVGYSPQKIASTMLPNRYTPTQVALGLSGVSAPDIGGALHSALSRSDKPNKKNRLGAVVTRALNSVGVGHGEIARTLREAGHGNREVVNHLQSIGLEKPGAIATALHKGGFSGEEIARGMVASRYDSKEVVNALRALAIPAISDAMHKALVLDKYRGKGEQLLANEFAAVLKQLNPSHIGIAEALGQKGYAGNKVVAALKANGFTKPADVVEALKKSGYDDFQAANYMSGEFTAAAIAKGLEANGAKNIPGVINDVLKASKYPAPSSAPKLASEVASALVELDYTHGEIAAELHGLGHDGNSIVTALQGNGFTATQVCQGLIHAKYTGPEIATHMLSNGYTAPQVAVELNRLLIPNISAALRPGLEAKHGKGNLDKVGAVTAASLTHLGFSPYAIAESMHDAGHSHNVIVSSLRSAGFGSSDEIAHALYHVGFNHSQVSEAMLANGFKATQVAVELHAKGATYGEVQRALASANVSGRQVRSALEAIGFND